jgi:predicted PolB exonuclease-like 3'-5' exonuclease
MNKKSRNTTPESLLFWDIETVRRQKELDVNSDEFALYQYKFRNKDTGELMPDAEVVKHYEKNAALYPAYNKIVCISVGFIKGDTLYYKAITGEQKDIITEFYTLYNSNKLVSTTYNGLRFDTPTVRIKAFESEVEVLAKDEISDAGVKPWDLEANNLDIMDLIKGSYYNPLSFAECCFLFGVRTPKGDISGADVSRVYWDEGEEGLRRIAKYCNEDVRALAELFCSITGRKGFIKNFVDKTGSVVEKPKLIDTIALSKSISKDQEKALIAEAKTLSKEERAKLVLLLEAALLEEAVNYDKLLTKLKK